MRILFIVGSLRKESMNLQVARQIARDLEHMYDVECPFLDYRDIPAMNEDIEFPAPAAVEVVRKTVEGSDGLWFVTPEYNHSYPGLLKNLVDWLSRPVAEGDPMSDAVIQPLHCAVTSVAGSSHGKYCIAAMKQLLEMVSHVMTDPMLGIGYTREEEKTSVFQMTDERLEAIRAQESAFLAYLRTVKDATA